MTIITGVRERVRQNELAFPYITYGSHVGGTWPTFGHWNFDGLFLMDIWSQSTGADQCNAILAEVKRLLVSSPSNAPLTLPDYGMAKLEYEWHTIMNEVDDNSIWHMPVRFRAFAVET
jgi:hypothetical protein